MEKENSGSSVGQDGGRSGWNVDAAANTEARRRQEEAWASADVNARKQLHEREGVLRYKNQMKLAMKWYWSCAQVINLSTDRTSFLHALGLRCDQWQILAAVVSYAFPIDQSDVFRELMFLSKALASYNSVGQQGKDCAVKGNKEPSKFSSFKIFIRRRPLLPFEEKQDEYAEQGSSEAVRKTKNERQSKEGVF